MQRSYTEFVHELIKGKISEIVFQHLFSEHGFASVLPFGYEHTTHLLTQYQLQIPKETLDNIRYTPDFVLIKPDHTNAVFVDVKYRKTLQPHRVLELAERVEGKWPGCWLFLATQDRFFFAPCAVVIDRSGQIPKLRTQIGESGAPRAGSRTATGVSTLKAASRIP